MQAPCKGYVEITRRRGPPARPTEHPGAAVCGWAVGAAWGSPPHLPRSCLLEPAELSWDFLEPS